jgi:serine/threonine protein kinase
MSKEDIEREARAVGALCNGAHANLVTIYRQGWLDLTYYYIDMEFCDMTLDEFIRGNSDSLALRCPVHPEFLFNEALPAWWKTTENLKVLSQITSGLAFIHKNNYVHRDLKPANSTFPHSI